MLNNFKAGTLSAKHHWTIFCLLLLAANTVSLLLFGFVRIIFYDFPFEVTYEAITLLKLSLVASGFAGCISLLLIAADAFEYILTRRKEMILPAWVKSMSVVILAAIILLAGCDTALTVGVKKDFNTGLSSSYNGMEPEKVMLVMNNEVLNHTDIPLGESFLLVNDGIKGLQVKNGKVTVGCSLKISDQMGKILMEEKDLFAGHDTFEEKDAKMLKCTVSTGEPMKWEEKYNVAVTFWDKNGPGKIENNVTIRCIDIP